MSNRSPLNNCTLRDITDMCFEFNLYHLVLDVMIDIDSYVREADVEIPESADDWINTNLKKQAPHSAIDVILDIYECSTAVDGTYTCKQD